MKIAVLGKGGSGKSTVSAHLVRFFAEKGCRVLAIDADHNMDLGFNLGMEPKAFLGTDPGDIKEFVGVSREASFQEALGSAMDKKIEFSITPADPFTAKYASVNGSGVSLLTAGPHTKQVRSQESCSHSLAAPLKVYLPRLVLKEKEVAIIDERAGTDPVATGILKGVDLALIVREGTPNSKRVAKQIADELDLQEIKYLIVDNKERGLEEDMKNITRQVLGVTDLN